MSETRFYHYQLIIVDRFKNHHFLSIILFLAIIR